MADNEPIRETGTIEMLFERYLDWVQENRKPGTYEKVRYHLTRFAAFIGKQAKIASLSGTDLADWVEDESTWNSTTRNDAITSVVRCFNWAVGKKYLKTNNVAHVPDKPARKRREVVFSADEWTKLRSYDKDKAFGDLVDFMWESVTRRIHSSMLCTLPENPLSVHSTGSFS